MKIVALVLSLLLSAFMIYAGIAHMRSPAVFLPFVPGFLPWPDLIVAISGWVEILLGAALMVPSLRARAGWAILVMLLVYLPLHLWDVVRAEPAIGSHRAALVRLPFQFIFIAWAWFVATRAVRPRTGSPHL